MRCLQLEAAACQRCSRLSIGPPSLPPPAGAQASSAKSNYLAVMKVSGLALSKAAAARQREQQKAAQQKDGEDGSDSDDDMLAGSDSDEEGEWACAQGPRQGVGGGGQLAGDCKGKAKGSGEAGAHGCVVAWLRPAMMM